MKKESTFIALIVLMLTSCKKVDHSVLLTIGEFPTTTGSWWKYLNLRGDNSILDTVTYTILDTQIISGESHQRWVVTQTGLNAPYPDTTTVSVSSSSIGFSATLNFQFPIVDNEIWCSTQQGFNYTTNFQNRTVNGISYNGIVYLNKYDNLGAGYTINESYWIMKNIGFVEKYINDDLGGYSHLTLISYHIN